MYPEFLALRFRNFELLVIMLIILSCYIKKHGERCRIFKYKSKKNGIQNSYGDVWLKNLSEYRYVIVLAQWLLLI